MKNNECCPIFDPKKWDNKTHKWKNKPFIKESIPTLFHMPFPPMIGMKMKKMCDLSYKSKKNLELSETLALFRDPTPFKSEIYMLVKGKVKDATNVKINGEFISRVYDGPYNKVPKFMNSMDLYLDKKGKVAKDYYIHYTYCPKCSKKYGHNYMILFARI